MAKARRFHYHSPTTNPAATAAYLNHPMQPNGKIGRFGVDDQPSQPADQCRSGKVWLMTVLADPLSLTGVRAIKPRARARARAQSRSDGARTRNDPR